MLSAMEINLTNTVFPRNTGSELGTGQCAM